LKAAHKIVSFVNCELGFLISREMETFTRKSKIRCIVVISLKQYQYVLGAPGKRTDKCFIFEFYLSKQNLDFE